MSYRLNLADDPGDALRRTATERLDHALGALDGVAPDERDAAVHTARKDVKKARALLRLHRSGLGRGRYRRENAALRDAARELSELRDARVLLDTVDALADHFAGRRPAAAFDALRAAIDAQPPTGTAGNPDGAVEDGRARLSAVARRVERWDLRGDAAAAVATGLRRSYQRGREAAREAERRPTDEHLHEWRKRAKDLRHQQELLRDAWPKLLGAQAKAAKDLADLLGDDHDLAVLTDRMDGEPVFEELRELVEHRRAELQGEAFRLGRRIYAESPKRFTKRVRSYLRRAQREAPAELAA
jgi:CHAD domain-containing protein